MLVLAAGPSLSTPLTRCRSIVRAPLGGSSSASSSSLKRATHSSSLRGACTTSPSAVGQLLAQLVHDPQPPLPGQLAQRLGHRRAVRVVFGFLLRERRRRGERHAQLPVARRPPRVHARARRSAACSRSPPARPRPATASSRSPISCVATGCRGRFASAMWHRLAAVRLPRHGAVRAGSSLGTGGWRRGDLAWRGPARATAVRGGAVSAGCTAAQRRVAGASSGVRHGGHPRSAAAPSQSPLQALEPRQQRAQRAIDLRARGLHQRELELRARVGAGLHGLERRAELLQQAHGGRLRHARAPAPAGACPPRRSARARRGPRRGS